MLPLRHQSGFSISYIIVGVAGVVCLLTLSLALFNPPAKQAKTMDSQRKSDLVTVQRALEDYAASHSGLYPVTTSVATDYQEFANHQPQCYGCGLAEYSRNTTTDLPFTKDDWIPNLVDQGYLPTLPTDPQNGLSQAGLCGAADWPRGYVYVSNGQNYKLWDFCTATTGLNPEAPEQSPYCIGDNRRILQTKPTGQLPLNILVDPKQPGFHYAVYSAAWACL